MSNSKISETLKSTKQNIDAKYQSYSDVFDKVETIFFVHHKIRPEILRATIKQRLLGALNGEISSRWINGTSNIFLAALKYYMFMGYLLVMSLFGPKSAASTQNCQILFDCVGGYRKFYSKILDGLLGLDCSILYTEDQISAQAGWPKVIVKRVGYSRDASRAALKLHFNKFFLYYWNGYQNNLDVVDLVIRLIRQVIIFKTEVDGIRAEIFVSSQDNGFTPLRYQVYKNSGIKSILLIQNGAKVELLSYQNSYIHCDIFCGWTSQRMNLFFEMNCANKVEVGSVLLDKENLKLSKSLSDSTSDIAIVEQIYPEHHKKNKAYLKMLNFLVRYCKERPEKKILYLCREDRDSSPNLRKCVDKILANIAPMMVGGKEILNNYQKLYSSKLLISVDSSMRHEALMLGVPILSIDTHDKHVDFILESLNNIFISDLNGYADFKKSIDFLLYHDNESIVNKQLRMAQSLVGDGPNDNASITITNLIKNELRI